MCRWLDHTAKDDAASMGPRSDNRGCDQVPAAPLVPLGLLQWVHGRITVVVAATIIARPGSGSASMGPRSDNRGCADPTFPGVAPMATLQWVHGRITVVVSGASAPPA